MNKILQYNIIIQIQFIIKMQLIPELQHCFEKIYQYPEQFNELSRQAIISAAKLHNTHNRLLPGEFVAAILEQLSQINPFSTKKSSLQFTFYFNILRHILLSNFYSLQDNKVFALIAMIYADQLNLFYHSIIPQQKSLAIIRHIAQMAIINEITLKYAQKTKIFFPQFIRTIKISLLKLQQSINRNLKHPSKTQIDISTFSTTDELIKIAFSKNTQKNQLIFLLIGLLNALLRQAVSFFNATSNKKAVLQLKDIQEIIVSLEQFQLTLPENITPLLVIPPEFKKYEPKEGEENVNQDEPIYLEEPIQVRQLTPRFYDEEEATQTKLLRKKKNKLEKKMHLQLRQATHEKLQERRVIENVKKQKVQRQFKKETFILQKQTQEAKKAFKQMKKVKSIKKETKLGRKGKK